VKKISKTSQRLCAGEDNFLSIVRVLNRESRSVQTTARWRSFYARHSKDFERKDSASTNENMAPQGTDVVTETSQCIQTMTVNRNMSTSINFSKKSLYLLVLTI